MNWEAIGAIGEILGALGVIITLAYLATQIRQNTKMARGATRQELAGQLQLNASDLVTGEDIARILQSHFEGKDLTPTEALRLGARAFRDFRFFENAYYQYSEGFLTDDEWRGFRENLKVLLKAPAYSDYWESEKTLYSRAFAEEVASVIGEPLVGQRGRMIFDARAKNEAPESEN